MIRILALLGLLLCLCQQTQAQHKVPTSHSTSTIDSLSTRFDAAKGDAAKINVLTNAPKRINEYYDKPTAILTLYNKALVLAKRIGDRKSSIKLLMEIAYLEMIVLMDEPKAFTLYLQALSYAEAKKDYASCAKICFQLTCISEHQNLKAEMYDYLEKSIAYNQKSPVLFLRSYRWASWLYLDDNRVDDALRVGRQAVRYVDERSAPAEFKALAYGYYYAALKKIPGRKQEADAYKQKIVRFLQKIITLSGENNLHDIATVCYEVEQYKLAIFFASQLFKKTDVDSKRDAAKIHCYEMISASYERLGDYQKSLEFYKKYSTTYVKVLKNVASLESGRKVIRAEGERNLLLKQNEIEKERLYRNLAVAIAAFVLVLAGVIFFFYRSLQHQKRELTHLNATKDKLFAILSHDLRSPVANLQSKVALTNWGALSQQQFVLAAQHLATDILYVSTTLDNLLHWTLTQMKGLNTHPTSVPLASVVQDQMQGLQLKATAKSIAVHTAIAPDVYLYIDQTHLAIIIRNLLQNALKFTEPGGDVSISYTRQGGLGQITIRDTGIGMEPDRLANLFRLDKQTSRPSTAQEPGTGLGLILVKELIEANGGQVAVESEVGRGSTFTLTLPCTPYSHQHRNAGHPLEPAMYNSLTSRN